MSHSDDLDHDRLDHDNPDPDDPGGSHAMVAPGAESAPAAPFDADGVVSADEVAPPRRRRILRYVAGGVGLVLIAVIVASAFIRVPYYRFSPGSLYATESLITVNGSPSYKEDGGQIDFTTVSSKKASVLDALLSRFDESTDLWDADLIEGGKTSEQNRQANLELMVDAKQVATVVALRKLGYEIKVEGTGALVKGVDEKLPANGLLQPNEAIVAIDGQPIVLGDDLVDAIGARKPGDTVTLHVEAAPKDPGRDVTVTLTSRCAQHPSEPCSDEDAQKPLLGVALSTREMRFQLPVSLDIDTKDVGGPSAGLAITLGVIDVLTPGSLTGGAHVATTGTIDPSGRVGPIGGIKQKTYLAMRSGVSLFIVPAEERAEAESYAKDSGLKVVGVGTLDEALDALRTHGGSTDVVSQAAAANGAGTTVPSS